jgi:uncharacterized RDD family membrane protein YckC
MTRVVRRTAPTVPAAWSTDSRSGAAISHEAEMPNRVRTSILASVRVQPTAVVVRPPLAAPRRRTLPVSTRPATMAARLVAFVIDLGVVGTPVWVFGAVMGLFRSPVRTCHGVACSMAGGSAGVVALFYTLHLTILVAYGAWLDGRTGTTIGKRLVGIHVIDDETGATIGTLRALRRQLVLIGTGLAAGLGLFTPLLDPSGLKQGWHDRIAHSLVVDGASVASLQT